jgi:hypothetical protein
LLATLAFVKPHRGSTWTCRRVAATDPRPRPHPAADRPLELDEFHARTATTALQVLVDGVLVHVGRRRPRRALPHLTYRTLPAIAATVASRERVQA